MPNDRQDYNINKKFQRKHITQLYIHRNRKIPNLLITETLEREREREMTVAADKNVWKELAGFICKGRHPPDQLQIPKPPTLSFSDARAKVPRTEENLTEESSPRDSSNRTPSSNFSLSFEKRNLKLKT